MNNGPAGDEVAVDHLDPADRPEAVAVAARAFWRDPLFDFFAPDVLREHLVLPIFIAPVIDDCRVHGEVWSARGGNRCVGVAAWLPPGALPRGASREARLYAASTRALIRARNRRRGFQLLGTLERKHPRVEHWYLAVLTVDPGWQRRGIGGRLLQPVLRRCDAEGRPAYLETQKVDNVVFYRRFGFEVLEEVRIPGSPTVWLMWREARPGDGVDQSALP